MKGSQRGRKAKSCDCCYVVLDLADRLPSLEDANLLSQKRLNCFDVSTGAAKQTASLFLLPLLGLPAMVRTAEVMFRTLGLAGCSGFSALELLVLLSVVTALLPVGLILLLVLRPFVGMIGPDQDKLVRSMIGKIIRTIFEKEEK